MGQRKQDGPSGPVPPWQQLEVPTLKKCDVILVVQEIVLDGDVPSQGVGSKDFITELKVFLNMAKDLGNVVLFAPQKPEKKLLGVKTAAILSGNSGVSVGG